MKTSKEKCCMKCTKVRDSVIELPHLFILHSSFILFYEHVLMKLEHFSTFKYSCIEEPFARSNIAFGLDKLTI